MARAAKARFPDGLGDGHVLPTRYHRHASLFSLLVLGGIVALAMTGVLGGGKAPSVQAAAPAATLTVVTPHTLRSGLFFETRIAVAARQPIADVVIAVPPGLWHEQTINTAIPAPESEEVKDSSFRFHYGPLTAGETLELKFDGQINPPLFAGTRGAIALLDGERPIATVPLRYRVLP